MINADKHIEYLSNLTDFEVCSSIGKLDEEEILSLLNNYNQLCKHDRLARLVIEYVAENNFETFSKFVNIDFWKSYAQIGYIDISILFMCSKCNQQNNIFNEEALMEMVKYPNIRTNIFPYIKNEFQLPIVDKFIKKLSSKDINNTEMDVLRDIIQFVYSGTGPINSSIYNVDAKKNAVSSPLAGFELQQKPKGFTGYTSFIEEKSNSVSLAYLFKDMQLKKAFLLDFSLLSSLSREDRSELYSNVVFDELNDLELQNLQKLMVNGYITDFSDSLMQSDNFTNLIVKNTDVTSFRRSMATLQFTNPVLSNYFTKLKQHYLDRIMFNNEKISKKNYPWVEYENGEQDSFVSCLMYIYFKSCPNDVYVATELILDSINSLDNLDELLPQEGVDVLNCLRKIVNLRKNAQDNFTMSTLNRIKDGKIVLQLKQLMDIYLEKYGEFNLSEVMEECRIGFGKNMQNHLTTSQTEGVEYKDINGVGVYDLSECDDFHLLIHGSMDSILPTINNDETLISMSLLDNNHLKTFRSQYVFGFNDIPPNNVIHAYNYDTSTGWGIPAKLLMYQKITNYAPIYTDLESFMNSTNEETYNEIKIKANANALNERGEQIMKPSYLLFIGENIEQIPQHIIEASNKLNLDIYMVDKSRVKRKEYNPVINENEIIHGNFQSRQ